MHRTFADIFALPVLLTFIVSMKPGHAQDWPYNLPPDTKYYPEHEFYLKRNLEIQRRLSTALPSAIRKMSEDEGEKFFLDYWQFDILDHALNLRRSVHPGEIPTNTTAGEQPLPPFLVHSESQQFSQLRRFLGRGLFERAYQCPTGTTSCESIGRPNSCCATGETCVSLSDETAGCCPSGASCGGKVGPCDTAAGYTSCENGGCCIPGYTCQGIGCVYASTATTTTTLPMVTITTGASWSTLSDSTTTKTFVVTQSSASEEDSVRTVTTTLIITPSTHAETTTVVQTTTISPSTNPPSTSKYSPTGQGLLTCSTGFRTCPASLGGGCCPTDRACGSLTCPPLSTAAPPVLPTSGSGSGITPVSSTESSSAFSSVVYSGCPTGFYMCSAYYLGGCCRVGRDCESTSCPASASTAVVTNTGLTIAAPTGSSSTAITGRCANGWSSCPANAGGGCCPSGYECGASCTATVSGQGDVGKGAPSEAARAKVCGWMLLGLGIVAGAGMILL